MKAKYENLKDRIVQELNKRVPNLRCPACSSGNVALGGGFFAHDLQSDLNQRKMGGINIPTVPVICENCGYVMEFAVGTLGLLPKKEDIEKEKIDSPTTPEYPK